MQLSLGSCHCAAHASSSANHSRKTYEGHDSMARKWELAGRLWRAVFGALGDFPLTENFAHGASARAKCKAPCSATLARRRSPGLQLLEQPIDERSLPRLNFLACFGRRAPRCAVDLRKGLFPTALRRPFHLEMDRGEPRRL